MLALGTVLGTAFGMVAVELFPHYHLEAGTFAIAGLGALVAATIPQPLKGIHQGSEMIHKSPVSETTSHAHQNTPVICTTTFLDHKMQPTTFTNHTSHKNKKNH
ncbi:chloride channel protein, partial [Escherichia coli]|uniref:chloride channel protein n=1 Tax=Escherichia coli TaxID=562 RepID=UPI0020252292